MRREVAQVAVVPGRLDAAVDARRTLFVVTAGPDAVTVRGLGAELRVEALVDQRVLRLVEQVVDPDGRPRVCEPAAHVSPSLVVEARRVRGVVYGGRLLLQTRQLPLQVVDEHVRDVVGKALLHDDAKRREILPIGRKGVSRNEPATLAHRARDVEDAEVVDLVSNLEGEHGELVSPRQQLKRPELFDLAGESYRNSARVCLPLAITTEAEPQEVVVLRDHLRTGP